MSRPRRKPSTLPIAKPKRRLHSRTTVWDTEIAEIVAEKSRRLLVPTRWLKFVAAFLMLPMVWASSSTFFQVFGQAYLTADFWRSLPFAFFAVGAVLWLVMFLVNQKPVFIYVLGHELTHALFVWLMGGKVSRIEISDEGGWVETDRSNFVIALAPYFLPIYSLLVVGLYAVVDKVWAPPDIQLWLFAGLGFTWSFHLTFTLWMLPNDQSDIQEHGAFFSLVIIYLMNLLVLSGVLVLATPGVTFAELGQYWIQQMAETADAILTLAARVIPV